MTGNPEVMPPGLVPINALVVTELSKFIDWPETGLGEINGDFLEADLWPALLLGPSRAQFLRYRLRTSNCTGRATEAISGS